MTGIRGRRRKQLLDDLKEKRGYWKLKEEALDRTPWISRFVTGCRLVRQTALWRYSPCPGDPVMVRITGWKPETVRTVRLVTWVKREEPAAGLLTPVQ
jgi:hypothetical protein